VGDRDVSNASIEGEGHFAPVAAGASLPVKDPGGTRLFWVTKRTFDVTVALLGLPLLLTVALLLLVLNPLWNPGPLFYRQRRMARGCGVMVMWKFRTMRAGGEGSRGPEDPVEVDRITPFGWWLRRTRIDELPQLINVIGGDMSLIGPRPDAHDHARAYIESVPNYDRRYMLRPGISGLAQVKLGYAEGSEMVAAKTSYDLMYISNAGWRMEASVLFRTMLVILTGFGAR
jgi:lipopolysaccharide/colanic/teichoic acid biosynthesis glycosyltransferase